MGGDMSENEVRVVFCTVPDDDMAAALSATLVNEQLCACVNRVSGIRSVYAWEGELKDDQETLLIMKTGSENVDRLVARVAELHPYDLPEVIAMPVVAGSQGYLDWVLGGGKEGREQG